MFILILSNRIITTNVERRILVHVFCVLFDFVYGLICRKFNRKPNIDSLTVSHFRINTYTHRCLSTCWNLQLSDMLDFEGTKTPFWISYDTFHTISSSLLNCTASLRREEIYIALWFACPFHAACSAALCLRRTMSQYNSTRDDSTDSVLLMQRPFYQARRIGIFWTGTCNSV
jgi:hypothetical protein